MGLFDSVLGAVSDQLQQQGGLANVMGSLLAADGGQGGLSGLVDKFNQAGLGEVVGSWIGKGENLPISADQIASILGSDAVSNVARQLGIDPAQAAGQLSQMLPGLIDQITPNGAVPQGGLGNAGDLMGMLGGLLKQ